MNLLIVEDEWINAQYIKTIVEDLEHTVIDVVKNAKDALETFEENDIHLVFMDINIHGAIDGIQCADMINKIKKTPIIYLTAYADVETVKEATHTNIYGYITKPFDNKNIEIALSLAIARMEQEKPIVHVNNPLIRLNSTHCFNSDSQMLTYLNKHVKLTKTETKLMSILSTHSNTLVSLNKIHSHVYNSFKKSDSTLRDLVSRLRKKVPHLTIKNVHGMGYCLETH